MPELPEVETVARDLRGLIVGATMLLTAIGVDRTGHRDITPLWYFFGSAAFLAGLFDLTKRTPLEISFLAAAAGFVYLSVVVHSRTLLVVATLAILAYTGWFTGEHFADSIGWPLALIAFGIFMIGLSALALALWPVFSVVLAARVLHAGASCVLGPVIAAISLGLVGHAALGPRLRFPLDFVGRGDMSRGGLLLRCARAGTELTYVGVGEVMRRGPRPPRLPPPIR